MTQSETERLKEIRERQGSRTQFMYGQDIDFLLSLLDSQAAGKDEIIISSCGNTEMPYREARVVVDRIFDGVLGRAESIEAIRRSTNANDAATQMRDACVERLGQVDRAHILSNNQDYERGFRDAIRSAQTALSSLTLDQVKQKEETNE